MKNLKSIQLLTSSTIFIYGFYLVFQRCQELNKPLEHGILGITLLSVIWLVPYLPSSWLGQRPPILLIQIYYVGRLIILFAAIYLLFGQGLLTIYEVLLGYFLLLLISFLGIKN